MLKTAEVTKIWIRNVMFYIIKRAENGTAFIFGVESPLLNFELKAKMRPKLDFFA